MGNYLIRVMCPIYPQPDSDSDNDSIYDEMDPLKPSEVMEREYQKKEKKGIESNILLRPSQIIKMEDEKLRRLSNNN
jgi:hypothetical protein